MSAFKMLRSIKTSTDTPVKAILKGDKLPSWLNGTLFRNGPGRYEFKEKSYSHLFDGQACVHKFKIENGQVFYSNKLLETKCYLKTIENDRLYPQFGTSDDKSSIIDRINMFLNQPEHADNVNINVVPFANGQLYALTEGEKFCRLDPETLKIINTEKINKYLPSQKTLIAHPHVDKDGTWINLGLNKKGKYEFIRFKGGEDAINTNNAGEHAESIASIDSTHKMGLSYFHSFGITQNYIVFLEQALKISFKEMLNGILFNKPFSEAMVVEKDFPTKIYLINKKTGEVNKQKFYSKPQFTFHFINCYENKSNEVVIDLSSMDINNFNLSVYTYDAANTNEFKIVSNDKSTQPTPRRITVPLNKSENNDKNGIYCEMKDLNTNLRFDLPAINYMKNNGMPYRYVYGTNTYNDIEGSSIIKFDVENPAQWIEMKYGKNNDGSLFSPSEPVFVENPNPTSEDDGVLLVMVLANKQNDFLSVLDAKTLKEIARAELPSDVKGAFTFHGFFADNQNFKKLN